VSTYLTIVIVEDNDDLRELTADALRAQGHQVCALPCAEAIDDALSAAPADVFLIDLNLPGEDGLGLARRIRNAQPLVGIIIISARAELTDKVVGYDSGADVYLPKPVPLEELSAALKSFARRRQAQRIDSRLPGGPLRLEGQHLQGPSGRVKLTHAEEVLLTAFARAPGGRLESWQLAELLGSDLDRFNKSSLELRIVRLRKKLNQAGATGPLIESLRSVGYQLMVPVQAFL
jgi:DNA-binding response OmpR family regulator